MGLIRSRGLVFSKRLRGNASSLKEMALKAWGIQNIFVPNGWPEPEYPGEENTCEQKT